MAFIETTDNGATYNGDDGDVDDYIGVIGNDNTLNGGAGEDTLEVAGNNNVLNGGDDNDTLGASGNDNVLNGGAGEDTLVSVDGNNNTLNGDADNDELFGSEGNDILNGGPGDDLLDGGGGADTFKFSFTLEQEPGEAKSFKFTDWLSEKYGKDFGDELPDFVRGHHHHGHHHHHHGHHHHHKHGGCDDHQPQQWGLSQSFFSKNYSEWLREVVVADLVAQGLDLDANGDGRIGVGLNQNDPDGTPRIEGLTDEQLSAIFSDRDEVTLRHGHHGHDKWYSNTYTSATSEGETTVASNDGFDTIFHFNFDEDKLEFSGLGSDFTLEQFMAVFQVAEVDAGGTATADMQLSLMDDSWSVTLLDVGTKTVEDFYDVGVFS